MQPSRESRFRGLVLGTAVGDALGLPLEGLSRRRAARLFPGEVRHRLLPYLALWARARSSTGAGGRGMLSDDTEHTFFAAQALLSSGGDPERFRRSLAWRLRGWLLGLPAGVGFATLRSILRMWVGLVLPVRPGVFSAGNGPAMRSAVLGAFSADDVELREALVLESTRLTHTDPRALLAAAAVAEVAAWNVGSDPGPPLAIEDFVERLRSLDRERLAEWSAILDSLLAAGRGLEPVAAFADRLLQTRGVSGYALHTVPVALYAWWRHQGDVRGTLESVLRLGGDTDTVGAIAGALAGVTAGEEGIPREWIDGILEWPRGTGRLRELASRLARASLGEAQRPVRVFLPGVLPRNAVFLVVVLAHGFRRLLPPW